MRMMSLHDVRSFLGDPALSDADAAAIRAEAYLLAEIIVDHWLSQQTATGDARADSPELGS